MRPLSPVSKRARHLIALVAEPKAVVDALHKVPIRILRALHIFVIPARDAVFEKVAGL